jgi:hypothetical protein
LYLWRDSISLPLQLVHRRKEKLPKARDGAELHPQQPLVGCRRLHLGDSNHRTKRFSALGVLAHTGIPAETEVAAQNHRGLTRPVVP